MSRMGLALTILLLKVATVAYAEGVPVPGWDPNQDKAFIADYVRRELTVDLERVDPRRGVSGVIRNDGKRTLTRARVLLTFLDSDNKSAGEFEFSALPWSGPVAPGEPQERPLGAGQSRKFLVYPSAVPSGWSSRWQAAVSSITFAPEPSS